MCVLVHMLLHEVNTAINSNSTYLIKNKNIDETSDGYYKCSS